MAGLSDYLRSLFTSEASPQRSGPRPEQRGPLGREYTDPFGRRIYQSDVPNSEPVVMERDFTPPEGHFQQPDMYNDATTRRIYYEYMANLPENNTRPNQRIREYYLSLLRQLDAAGQEQGRRLNQHYRR